MSHWESSIEWDSTSTDQDTSSQKQDDILSGSYHCKSALRPFESNMKHYLFKTSYNALHSLIGSDPYTDEVVCLLPDLWACFYQKTHGLDRVMCLHTSKTHSTGSDSFLRWADYTAEKVLQGDTVTSTITCEAEMFGLSEREGENISTKIKEKVASKCGRLLYLVQYFHLILIVMNYRYNRRRPDVSCTLSGIVFSLGDDIYRVKYNDFIYVDVLKDAVRIKTPSYDQIVQKDFILNLSDKIVERFNIMVGSFIISNVSNKIHSTYDDDKQLTYILEKVILWGDNLLYKTKNSAFDLISKYEAYCVSAILREDDPLIWNNLEFQNNLLNDDSLNNPHLYPFAIELVGILNTLSSYILSEIHGIWRIWGHPIIDIEGGMKKMEATSLKKTNVDQEETATGVRTFKLTFFSNYRAKHGHYPLSNLSEKDEFDSYRDHLQKRDITDYNNHRDIFNPLSYVHNCIKKNRKIDNYSSGYTHEDWDDVILLQNFQVPQSMNLATMIKDKAISQTRSELVQSVTLKNSVFDSTKRRGVLKWLSEQTTKLREYLTDIDVNGIKENDRIIGLYPKERELKTKARFFSLMSYNMRMYVTATEEILSKYLLPYFPMITMSDTLLNMIIRLYNMTTNIGRDKMKIVYSMNIDFSKWNQNMREATNDGIFKTIDSIIGFRALISRTHSIFRQSYLYLCSGEYIPRIIRASLTTEHPYSRIGDESGKEGLRQKGWTITTVCDILSLAFQHKVKIELIGGGDNQVLTVEVRSLGKNKSLSEEEQIVKIKERMIRFRNALAKKMDKRGLPLKLEETWISHRLLMYNKIMYLDGVPLPGRLKVISRIFANANEGICTLGNITSTLGTGFQSISAKDYNPIIAWISSRYITYLNICMYFMSNPISGTRRLDQQILKTQHNSKRGLPLFGDEDEMASNPKQMRVFTGDRTLSIEELYYIVLYYHKVLGGPGIGSPLSYIMKGFPDTLSEALTFNYFVISKHKNKKTGMANIIECVTSVKSSHIKHWEHLLEDPVSVNHDAPSHGIAALRNQAEIVMKNADIKNIRFKELIKLGKPEYLKDLSSTLCSTDTIEPRLLHDIVGSTIPGYVNTILSKVDQSSTLSKLSTDADILYNIYCTEIKYYVYLATKCKVKAGHHIGSCPTADARSLRNSTWGKKIVGVTTPHPFAYLRCFKHSNTNLECDQNYITVLNKRPHPYGKMVRGPFKPYFGSYTAEKFKMNILASAYGEEDLLRRAMKIQKLLGWRFDKSTRAYKLIQMILSCVTNANPDKFLPVPEEITGDVEHRYHDMATKHGGIPTNLIRDYTNVSCNTSTFINHSKGASNETLHFQAAIIYCGMMSNLFSIHKKKCSDIYHFHEYCHECIQPTSNYSGDIPDSDRISLISCPTNELMYINENDIPVHYHSQRAFIKSQNRRTINGNEVIFHNLDEERDRPTWVVLLSAMLINKSSVMKQSSMKLHIESCSVFEMALVIKAMICVSMLDKRKPWTLANQCDIKDIVADYREPLSCMMVNKKLVAFLLEENLLTGEDYSLSDMMYSIANIFPDASLSILKNSYCKFQDPECSISKKIILWARVPSASSCYSCIEGIITSIEENRTVICSAHGNIPHEMKFHLYSLDKLSRNKGPQIESRDLEQNTKKQKRGLDLIRSVAENREKKKENERKIRANSFLLSDNIKGSDILLHVTHPMLKFKITTTYKDERDVLQNDVLRVMNKDIENNGKCFSLVIHYVICIIEAISETRVINRQSDISSEECVLGIDIHNKVSSIVLWKKALSIVSCWAEKQNIFVKIRLLCSTIKSLEDLDTMILEELVVRTRHAIKGDHLTVISSGDGTIDITGESSSCQSIVTMSPHMVPLSDCPVFFMTTGDSAYYDAAILSKIIGLEGGFSLDLIRPHISVNNPASMMIKCSREHGRTCGFSESKLLSAIDDTDIEYNYFVHTLIYDNFKDSGRSLINDLLEEASILKISIRSKADYDYYLSKIKASIKFYSLQTKQNDALPWRCILLIKVLLGLSIITDADKKSAARYYSCFDSVSFQGQAYRKLLLYKPGERPTRRGNDSNVLNWTPGGIGKGILNMLESIEEVFFIEYTHENWQDRVILL